MPKEKKQKISPNKTCFLITPIGQETTDIRKRVDQWEQLIYKNALGPNYKIIRADKIYSPGIITEQIIHHITEADLAIIDYTGMNANVMYEAAIRHLTEKPFIQIYETSKRLPFDIHNLRSISYDPTNLNYPSKLIQEIKNALREINSPGYKQPQLIKEKFDFNKIVSDPEKFVALLTKHINFAQNNKKSGSALVTFSEDYNSLPPRVGNLVNRNGEVFYVGIDEVFKVDWFV